MSRVGMKSTSRNETIAVFGSSRRPEDSPLYAEAYELGRILAQTGYTVMSGGYAGSMAAVSRGAAEAGGRVIGVTCAIFDPLTCNSWLTEEVKSASLMERLAIMVDRADGFVAVRGGIGTLAEVTLAWSMLQTRTYRSKPLVLLGSCWQPVIDAFLENTDFGRSIAALACIVATPADVPAALAAPAAPPTPLGPPPLG
jgi:uncharacterized protein (TIGR00730 family)